MQGDEQIGISASLHETLCNTLVYELRSTLFVGQKDIDPISYKGFSVR